MPGDYRLLAIDDKARNVAEPIRRVPILPLIIKRRVDRELYIKRDRPIQQDTGLLLKTPLVSIW